MGVTEPTFSHRRQAARGRAVQFLLATLVPSALLVSCPVDVFAQGDVFPGAGGQRNRQATNIGAPTLGEDSFTGQDKTGPYVLTYRKFLFGPGYPVWVAVDGRRLNGAEYSLDTAKGEVTFAVPVKRSQLVRVQYGYYPEMVERNPNPALSSPLQLTIASLGIGDVKMSTVNGVNGSSTPRVVLGLSSDRRTLGGGLTTQFLLAPDQLAKGEGDAIEQAAVKLGYKGGDSKNGLDLGFQRGGRDFASSVGRNFGASDAVQNLNFGGRLNPNATTSVSYERVDNRALAGTAGIRRENAGLKLGGGKGQPLLQFNRADNFTTDAKGVTTGSATDNSSLAGKFGAIDLAYKSNKAETAVAGKPRTIADQNVLSANLPGNKRGVPTLGFNRTETENRDSAGAFNNTVTEVGSLGTNLGRANVQLRNTQTDTLLAGNKQTSSDERRASIAVPGSAKSFRPTINFTRVDGSAVDAAGVRSDTGTDQADIAGKFGIADVVAKINRSETESGTNRTGLVEQQNIGVKVAPGKSPALGFQRTGDVKIDPSGLRVGGTVDRLEYGGKFQGVDFQILNVATDNATKERVRTISDQNTVTLRTVGAKGQPALSFVRNANDRSVNGSLGFGATTNRFQIDQKAGNVQVGLSVLDNSVVAPDQRRASGTSGNLRLTTTPRGSMPGIDYSREAGEIIDANARRAEVLVDQVGIQNKFGATGVKAVAKQSFTEVENPLDNTVGRESAFTIDRGGKRSSTAITVSNALLQSGRQTDAKQGLAVSFKPMPNLTLGLDQKEQLITPAGAADPSRSISTQTASAEVQPVPGARLFGARTTASDGTVRSGIHDLGAKLGTDKTLFKLEGNLRDRYHEVQNGTADADTASASFQVRPASFLIVTGNYSLNPEDPKKPGGITPTERREYGIKAKLGTFELGGTYAANELLPGTAADVIAKAGGAPQFGEMGLSLGMRFGANSKLTGGYKDTFFSGGPAAKGLATYTLGFTHNVGSRFNFSLNGTVVNNRAIVDPSARNDYKAEAKLGLKF